MDGRSRSTHITIQEGRSLPELKRCATCCKDFHCPFCRSTLFRPTKLSKVRTHLESHFKRAVLHEGYTIHRCGLDCRPQWHYHCIHCQSMLSRKPDFIKHLSLCKEKHRAATTTVPAPTTTVPAPTTTPASTTPTVPTTSTGQMQRIHPTIQRRRTLPQALNVSGQLFGCPFCCEKKFKAARQDKVVTHLEGHFNRAVVHGDVTIHRCGLGCRDGLHFHCLYCGVMIGRRNDFRKHLQHCRDRHHLDAAPPPAKRKPPPRTSSTVNATPVPVTMETAMAVPAASSPLDVPPMSVTLAAVDVTPISETSSPLGAPPVSVTVVTVDATPISMNSSPMSVTMSTVGATPTPLVPEPSPPQKERRVVHTRCPVCHLLLNKNNLKKHIERKHREKPPDVSVKCHLTGQRVDQDNAIYAVLRSCSGHSVPVRVHVTIACDCRAAEQQQTEDVPVERTRGDMKAMNTN